MIKIMSKKVTNTQNNKQVITLIINFLKNERLVISHFGPIIPHTTI